MARPISPRLHGAGDYGFLAMFAGLPRMLQLPKPVTSVFTAMGVAQATLNAFTDQPFGVCRVIPFRTHGRIEKASAPVYVLLPLAAGAWQDRRSRCFFVVVGAVLVIVFNLTDWNSQSRKRQQRRYGPASIAAPGAVNPQAMKAGKQRR